jgi:hypothetical protein
MAFFEILAARSNNYFLRVKGGGQDQEKLLKLLDEYSKVESEMVKLVMHLKVNY